MAILRFPAVYFWLVTSTMAFVSVNGLGVNWGTQATHPLPPTTVAQLLQDNGITKVKLFDSDHGTLSAISGTGIEVMVAIPNGMLATVAGDYDTAKQWVEQHVKRYLFNGGVNIKYVAVGNEPFLTAYNHTFDNVTFPALKNIQNSLIEAGLGGTIKATVPFNAAVYGSQFPSDGKFRPDIHSVMVEIAQFLNSSGAPFTINIYPFISLYQDPYFPADFAFFDGNGSTLFDRAAGINYTNVFDANFDTLVSALKDAGVPDLPIIVGEIGWPTDGHKSANVANAKRFYDGLLMKLAGGVGTPLRPGQIEAYLFSLLDEDAKSTEPGNFERHWGIFAYDGRPKFAMDLSGKDPAKQLVPAKNVEYLPQKWCVLNPNANNPFALGKNVEYACTNADCTPLGYGSSCGNLDVQGNASYAFNIYYQTQSQKEGACNFEGLALVVTQNASRDGCVFPIQMDISKMTASRSWMTTPSMSMAAAMVLFMTMFLQFCF
ncbi:glucan endo-1,3-beta-glucosidase 8-like [Nymphaea colorata]|nr:glucan endo-1,3-beta-glucosidase 8-like [Nymphaea colorata]